MSQSGHKSDPKKTLALPLNFLKDKKPTNFDIYVWAAGKPVLYCRADDVSLDERISRLKSKKGLKYFLVLKDHYSAFIKYLGGDLESNFIKGNRSKREMVEDIYFQQRGLLICLSADLTSKEYYAVLKSTCASFYGLFSEDHEALRFLFDCRYEDSDFDLWLDHSIRTAALTARLLKEYKVDEPGKPVYEILMGSFLHDFGFTTKPWPFSEHFKTDNLNYKVHPTEGYELMDQGHISLWVRTLIQKHEEHIDGSGFPAGLRENDMDVSTLCVGICSAFDALHTLQRHPIEDALKQLLILKMGAYPLPMLQTLQSIVRTSLKELA